MRSSTMTLALRSLVTILIVLQTHITHTKADGTGLIGYGKTLYNPTCTFACRNVIRKQPLACTPSDSTENHGTAHNLVSTPPKCFVQDATFLKTMALCIDTYCGLSDKPNSRLIQDYWMSHLGTGTLGTSEYEPILLYDEALSAARQDEDAARDSRAEGNTASTAVEVIPEGLIPYEVTSPLVVTLGGSEPLNETSLISPIQWQLQYNYLSDFEANEKGHNTMTLAIVIVAISLPVLLSVLRFIPGLTASPSWIYQHSILIYPATFGQRHREPVAGTMVPTRGQSLYVVLISFLNVILLLAPYTITQPQASFTTRDGQTLSIVGNRAGVMAMGNVVVLLLFSSRNSILLYFTDWSYSTYLLLHRWLGYWAILHTVIHSCMLWSYYVKANTYSAEVLRPYWSWGIVGTVAACALIPLSFLWVRQMFYEFFIISHIVLSLVFLLGYYYHIWYVYTYNWGYEIWMFVATGIWALERLARIARMLVQGSRTAIVTIVPDTDGEYLKIKVEGKRLNAGTAYLCFPTLSWRFWETHPFSISGCVSDFQLQTLRTPRARLSSDASPTPLNLHEKEPIENNPTTALARGTKHDEFPSTIFYARIRSGITKLLANKASNPNGAKIRLRILIDGPYSHSGHMHSQLAQCSRILCIAGGVGITACLPLLLSLGTSKHVKLLWCTRKAGLVDELAPTLSTLAPNVRVETRVGRRFDVDAIIRREFVKGEGQGKGEGMMGIIVSGPPGLADEVRCRVAEVGRGFVGVGRGYVLVDEAFSW